MAELAATLPDSDLDVSTIGARQGAKASRMSRSSWHSTSTDKPAWMAAARSGWSVQQVLLRKHASESHASPIRMRSGPYRSEEERTISRWHRPAGLGAQSCGKRRPLQITHPLHFVDQQFKFDFVTI